MESKNKFLKLSEEQALFFRACRSHLAGVGAENPAQCAFDLLGLQAQQLAPGLLALSQRLASRPTANELSNHLFAEDRDLVRTWGQRDTIHIYDSETSWHQVVSARKQWSAGGRRGPLPGLESRQAAYEIARKKGLVFKKDFLSTIDPQYLAELHPRIGNERARAIFACGRQVWLMSLDGNLCQGEKQGALQIYATRKKWFPKLEWPHPLPDSQSVCLTLTRRYLRINAPATAHDVAHFFGAKVTTARKWFAVLEAEGELISIECGGRKGLRALAGDEKDLQTKPGGTKMWPVRLLPLWDTLLMSHCDKSWTMPDQSEHPLVWRKAAFVSSVVLSRGRVVGLWKMQRKGRQLDFELQPLGGWSEKVHRAGFAREIKAVARHLELECGEIK